MLAMLITMRSLELKVVDQDLAWQVIATRQLLLPHGTQKAGYLFLAGTKNRLDVPQSRI